MNIVNADLARALVLERLVEAERRRLGLAVRRQRSGRRLPGPDRISRGTLT